MIKEIKYGTTNTYLIKGEKGAILFDTGWAGTLAAFCHAMGEKGEKVQDINFILISHFHPDHMGIVQEIADMSPVICVADIQKDYIHSSDQIFARDKKAGFIPVRDETIRCFTIKESRAFLKKLGIEGEVLSTPGHSDDSISLMLDSGELFVGDLNPLYELELHRGTLTTNHNIKQLNRRLENALKDAELITLSKGKRENVKTVSACWDVLMLNQFHDILPGTCINEVNVQAVAEYKKAIDDLSALTAGESVFNTLWTDRTEILSSENGLQTYTDLDGREVSVDAFSFPAYGYGKRVSENYKSGCFSLSEDGSFKTPFYSGKIKNGSIVSLIFGGREISAGKLNEIKMYADVPLNWDNWDVDPDYELKPCAVTAGESYSVSEGALQLRIRTVFDLGGEGTLTQDTVFNSVDPMIAFENKLEWNGHHRFIKADFDTTVHAKTYRSEIQFGCVERPTTRNNSLEAAKYEVCNHRWTDISEPRFGVALLNREKYGVSVFGGKMGLSLLKSGKHPDTTGDKGTKYFEYALLPHLGGFAAENTVLPAYAFNRRPIYTAADINVPVSGVSAPNVIPETVKFPEEGDGTIVRLYECEGSVSECTVKFRSDSVFYQCDMLEENPVLIGKGRELKLSFGAFEIKTILVKDK